MKTLWLAPGVTLFGVTFFGVVLLLAAQPRGNYTYERDARPIFDRACIACHTIGGVGPMALTTYENTRPWIQQIKAVVTQKKMPPGVVERHYGLFGEDGSLHKNDIDIIVAWIDAGAPQR